jgi:excisionase family DNA binding protein
MNALSEQSFLTVREASGQLRVSRGTVYGLIRAGRLPAFRVGESLRIPRSALESWIEAQLAPGTQTRSAAAP